MVANLQPLQLLLLPQVQPPRPHREYPLLLAVPECQGSQGRHLFQQFLEDQECLL